MKTVAFLMLLGAAAAGKWDGTKEDVDLDVKIEFGWCRNYNSTHTCGSEMLAHAECYNLPLMDEYINDNLEEVSVKGGRCVLWERYDCTGWHTNMIVGENIFVDNLCSRRNWPRMASSIQCCSGDPGAYWCGKGGVRPTCD